MDPTAPLVGAEVSGSGKAVGERVAVSGGAASAGGFPAVGTGGSGVRSRVSGEVPVTVPREGDRAPGRRRLRWVIGLGALLVSAAAGVTYWMGLSGGTAVEGVWTGSARHPAADRVFPVEIRLDGESRMRWGADLHCSGDLSPTARGLVFTLGDVAGKECHPGTLHLLPTADANQMGISVIRQGQHDVTYSGRVSRSS